MAPPPAARRPGHGRPMTSDDADAFGFATLSDSGMGSSSIGRNENMRALGHSSHCWRQLQPEPGPCAAMPSIHWTEDQGSPRLALPDHGLMRPRCDAKNVGRYPSRHDGRPSKGSPSGRSREEPGRDRTLLHAHIGASRIWAMLRIDTADTKHGQPTPHPDLSPLFQRFNHLTVRERRVAAKRLGGDS